MSLKVKISYTDTLKYSGESLKIYREDAVFLNDSTLSQAQEKHLKKFFRIPEAVAIVFKQIGDKPPYKYNALFKIKAEVNDTVTICYPVASTGSGFDKGNVIKLNDALSKITGLLVD